MNFTTFAAADSGLVCRCFSYKKTEESPGNAEHHTS